MDSSKLKLPYGSSSVIYPVELSKALKIYPWLLCVAELFVPYDPVTSSHTQSKGWSNLHKEIKSLLSSISVSITTVSLVSVLLDRSSAETVYL